ncbi:MAG: hypothetical protein AAFP90_23965, partial [Planctomycetota bacterium]
MSTALGLLTLLCSPHAMADQAATDASAKPKNKIVFRQDSRNGQWTMVITDVDLTSGKVTIPRQYVEVAEVRVQPLGLTLPQKTARLHPEVSTWEFSWKWDPAKSNPAQNNPIGEIIVDVDCDGKPFPVARPSGDGSILLKAKDART